MKEEATKQVKMEKKDKRLEERKEGNGNWNEKEKRKENEKETPKTKIRKLRWQEVKSKGCEAWV